jgi:hypothetical protein
LKTCRKCKKDTIGCRSKACAHCGESFRIDERKEEQEKALEQIGGIRRGKWTVPADYTVPDDVVGRFSRIAVPAGYPPIRLKPINGGLPEDEDIFDWAVKVRENYIPRGWWLTNRALIYWARNELESLGDSDSEPILHVEELIQGFPDASVVSDSSSESHAPTLV